ASVVMAASTLPRGEFLPPGVSGDHLVRRPPVIRPCSTGGMGSGTSKDCGVLTPEVLSVEHPATPARPTPTAPAPPARSTCLPVTGRITGSPAASAPRRPPALPARPRTLRLQACRGP